MTSDNNRFKKLSPAKISHKFPIVLIRKLEDYKGKSFEAAVKNKYRKENSNNSKELPMKREAHNVDVGWTNEFTEKYFNNLQQNEMEKELITRKSVIIGIPKEQTTTVETCSQKYSERMKSSCSYRDKHPAMNMAYYKSKLTSQNQLDGLIRENRSNGIDDEQAQAPLQHSISKGSHSAAHRGAFISKLANDLMNIKEVEYVYQNDNRIELNKNMPDTMTHSNSQKNSPNKSLNFGKLTGHFEISDAKVNQPRYQEEKELGHEERLPLIIIKRSTKKSENISKISQCEGITTNVELSHINGSTSAKKSNYYIERIGDSNCSTTDRPEWDTNGIQSSVANNSILRPTDIKSDKCHNNSHHRIARHRISPSLISPTAIHNATKAPPLSKILSSNDDLNLLQRMPTRIIRRTDIGRSLSCGDLKLLDDNLNSSIKSTLSLPDFTPATILQLVGVPIRRASVKKSSDSNISSTWTADDAEVSDLSSSDDETKSLYVDEVNDSLAVRNSPVKTLASHNSMIEANERNVQCKLSRRKSYDSTYNQFKSNRCTVIPEARRKKVKKKRIMDKKRNKTNGDIINKIRLQQQVLHEQERGKRLAQELPGFNWLEEKIRNTTDSIKTSSYRKHDKYVSNSAGIAFPVSTALAKAAPADSKTSHKSSAVLIPPSDLPPISIPVCPLQAIDPVVESNTIMTLNTVSSSTPRHSPSAEETEKQTGTYSNPPSNEPSHEMQTEPANNHITYLKRHIQTAVPPLIPTYKVQALPKDRRTSLEVNPVVVDKLEEINCENTDSCEIGLKKNFKMIQRDADVDLSRHNDEDNQSEKDNFHERRMAIAPHDKLLILKEAFKSKLNGCTEIQRVECDPKNSESDAKIVSFRRQSIPEVIALPEVSEPNFMRSRSNSRSEEIGGQSTQAQMDKEVVNSTEDNPRTDSLLGKILMQDKTPINSPVVIATLLDELLKTRKEVEMLRKVQEQMLKGEKCYSEACHTNIPVVIDSPENTHLKIESKAMDECPGNSEKALLKVAEVDNSRKRKCPVEQDYPNKKQSLPSPPASEESNTITIRYTLPTSSSEYDHEATASKDAAKLRNMLTLCNNNVDLLPLDKLPSTQRQDVNFSRKHPPSNAQLNYPPEKSTPKDEPYRNELMKLLDPANKGQRSLPQEMPILIPSSGCSPTAFQKNQLYCGDKIPTAFGRYHYPPSSSSLPAKQINQTMEQYGYARYIYENRNGSLHEREMQLSPNHKLTKHNDKAYNTASSPSQRELMVARNERYANLSYPSLYNEKSPCDPAKLGMVRAPAPQTFQPKVLIPPENGVQHHNEWLPNPQYPSSITSGRPYQRASSQHTPAHVKSAASNVQSSTYHYKSDSNTKGTESYVSRKQYPQNGSQCESVATKQRREKSCSPADLRPHRMQSCVNPFNPPPGESHSSSNTYYSAQIRAMQSTVPNASANGNFSQYPPMIVPNRNLINPKQMFYDQRPITQQPQGQKIVTTFTSRSYSPPPSRIDGQQQKYMNRPPPLPPIYETRPMQIEARGKKPVHQSNSLSPDIAQPRMSSANEVKQFHASVNTSPIRNCSPNTSSDNMAAKMSSRKCLVCGRLAQFLCSGCKLGWYCSKECQREHWNEHSPTCTTKRI